MYIKRHPVPFAEYVPLRRIARLVSDQVDRVRSDFVAGTQPGVLSAGGAGAVGDVICFEVAYDAVVRDTVTDGAELMAVQTNNATFNEAEARAAVGDGAAAGGGTWPGGVDGLNGGGVRVR